MVSTNKTTSPQTIQSMGKRAAIYARVSTEIQEEEGTSLISQVQDCRSYCADRGYIVNEMHIYRDVHTGAEYRERPHLTQMREAMRRKEFDVIVVYTIDRLSRVQVHLAVLIDEAQYSGVSIEFVQQQFDDSSVGQFIRSVLGFVGEIEREKIIERTQRGKRARIESGKLLPGRKPLYGYKYDNPARKAKNAYCINTEEAIVVQRIFQMGVEGHTIRSIASKLNTEGIPSPALGYGRWTHTIIVRILKNRFYTGEAVAFKQRYTKVSGSTYHVEERPEPEQVKLPHGTVPQLIDLETFEKVQERLHRNKLESIRNNRVPTETLLRGGYIKCGYCGRNMVAARYRSNSNDRAYKCGNYKRIGNGCSASHCILTTLLDQIVWERIVEVVQNPTRVIEAIEKRKGTDPHKENRKSIERTLAKIKEEQANLLENLKELNPMYAQRIYGLLNELATQQQELETDLAKVIRQGQEWQISQEKLLKFQDWCTDFADRLGLHTYEEKRFACEMLGIKVLVWRSDHKPHRYQINVDPDIMVQSSKETKLPKERPAPIEQNIL